MLPCRNLYAVPDTVLLHRRFTLRRRGIAVPRNSLTCYTAQHLRIRRLILFIFAGAAYDNALTNCATRSCCASIDLITCVAEHYLTLRTGCEKHGRKNPLPYLISERSHVGNLRQIRKQGKGRSSKRKENRRLSFLFAPAVGTASSPPRGAARSRRSGGESPAEVQRKTLRPLGSNPPAAVRVPRWVGAEKGAAPFARTACAVRVSRLTLRSYLTILRRQSMLSQQQNRRKYEPVHPCTLRSVPRH